MNQKPAGYTSKRQAPLTRTSSFWSIELLPPNETFNQTDHVDLKLEAGAVLKLQPSLKLLNNVFIYFFIIYCKYSYLLGVHQMRTGHDKKKD